MKNTGMAGGAARLQILLASASLQNLWGSQSWLQPAFSRRWRTLKQRI
jgi:hypothetical protein